MGREETDSVRDFVARGLELMRRGNCAGAEDMLEKALAIEPADFDALRLRGIAAHLQGNNKDALGYLERAIAMDPRSAQTHYNLGVVLHQLGRPGDAIASFEQAIRFDPEDADAHDALGSALAVLKRYDEAVGHYRRAVELRPGFAAAHNNLAVTLTAAMKFTEAAKVLSRTIQLDPRSADARVNLGAVLNHLREYEKAKVVLQEAISLNDQMAEAHNNLGLSLSNLKDYEGALAAFNRAVALNPDHDAAFGYSALMTRRICDWSHFAEIRSELERRIRDRHSAISPFTILAFCNDPELQLQAALNYSRHKEYEDVTPVTLSAIGNDKRIRIAYVSADFREHPVAHQIAELIEMHDRSRFECTGISIGRGDQSEIGERLRGSFDRYVDVRTKSNSDAARLIAEEGIHIAVDLNGYTGDARAELFAHRPAPVQVNYLGYPCTMGAAYMDYIIVDKTIVPPEQQVNFSEKLVHLPDTYMVTDGKRVTAEHNLSRAQAGLPEDGIVFCCFHNAYKITPEIFDIWMRLLNAVPGSVIWLRVDDDTAVRNLRREAGARGIDPDRLVNTERVDMPDHMARHSLADLYLDTLPYNAHSSASDALMAGLPVVTCTGKTFASRVAASLLMALDMPELITETLQHYEALVLKLACDRDYLCAVHEKLARNRESQPLFDCARFCLRLEAAYEAMFAQWRAGKPPAPIMISAE